MTELRRSGVDVDSIDEKRIVEVFRYYADAKITKQAVAGDYCAYCKG